VNDIKVDNIRYPNDLDRIEGSKLFELAIKNKRINGKQLYPHQLIQPILRNYYDGDTVLAELHEVQWNAIKKSIVDMMDSKMQNIIPMIDVSGSMNSTYSRNTSLMDIAIGLGILLSEICTSQFHNIVMTFTDTPLLLDLNKLSLSEKVHSVLTAQWSSSTNFIRAFEEILQIIKLHKLTKDQIPTLVVFSDMQFNCASKDDNNCFILEVMKQKYRDAGLAICQIPYELPKIVFWNLDSGSEIHVQANTLNAQLITGFSPSLFKEFIQNTDTSTPIQTPIQVLHNILDDKMYDPVRNIVNMSKEKKLKPLKSDKAYR
jgi:hypothetical protein